MVIVLEKNIPQEDKNNLRSFLERNNFHVNEISGEEETILAAVGKLSIDPREVEILPGVDRVIPISKPYKMASREYKKENTVVEIPNNRGQIIRVGGQRIVAIAGPCAVETKEQMLSVAKRVAESGAVMLRGGAFKPRTSPYAFQGLGEKGVKILKEAGDAYGLPVVTEIVAAEHIPLMKDYIDVFQIGARNMQNFELLKKVGALGKPVILKRGLSATIEEWLMAAEYLLSSGTEKVILCERGIRTYEKATRNTLDLSAIPIVRSLTHLPIIVDPSHAVGIRDKVPPMGLAAIAAGADGIIVEVHCNPDKALSDGAQSLYPEQFELLMRDIDVLAPVVGKEIVRLHSSAYVKDFSNESNKNTQNSEVSSENPKKRPICAFSGGRGAYAEQAVEHYFDGEAETLPQPSFRAIFQAVVQGKADFGIIPIENSLAGSVLENYDNIVRFADIEICGAIRLRIQHSLIGVKGATLDTIKAVYSHPQGLSQCTDFLMQHPEWIQSESSSTSAAAELVAKSGLVSNAAIASEVAARCNHLEVIKTGIESNPLNYTRFLIVRAISSSDNKINCFNHTPFEQISAKVHDAGLCLKASIMFTVKNEAGALYHTLGVFYNEGFNLLRLESRPIAGEPWKYRFYADVQIPENNAENKNGYELNKTLEKLADTADDVRLLGVYTEVN